MLVDINGTKRWMWVIDPNHITKEDFRVNEAYELWIKNQIELYGRDAVLGKEEPDYLTKLAIELRDGKNYDTGKPLTDLEKAQRWATVASIIAVGGIAGYYANHPLTADQVTLKREPITGEKNGKKYTLDRNKSKGNFEVKTPNGLNLRIVIKSGGKMPNHIVIQKGRLSKDGQPNSSADILNPDGSVKQRRYYDEKGRALEDIDFNHSDDGTHEFPHRHKWDWSNPEKQKRLK